MTITITNAVKNESGQYEAEIEVIDNVFHVEFNHREAKIYFIDVDEVEKFTSVYLSTHKKLNVEGN